MEKQRPIYVIRKKVSHGGHHSGAWKVAYADFVTAMMALFIVLWLMNTSEHVRKAVAGYFNDPRGKSSETGTDRAGSADNLPLTKDNIGQLKEQLQRSIQQKADLNKLSNQIEMTVTPEGLRIELLESKDGTFFESGSTELSESGKSILKLVAAELKQLPNKLYIEGHTDSTPYIEGAVYGNWELSVDRANAARRNMQEMGIRQDQVAQVRGYADQRLRMPKNPMDPSNRRISLIVQYAPVVETAAGPPQATGRRSGGDALR
jgi:chemotaxis protein MotB